jgi:serine/threonine protein kinase
MTSTETLLDSTDEAATVTQSIAPTVPVKEPLLFGRYRTVRELGRGGMGVVVLAHDVILDVPIALKLIPETVVCDTEGIVDLKKEVLRGMELTHPNIVRVFSFEQDAKTAGIVMERVEGETLAQKKLQRHQRYFECDEIFPWLQQLCAALDYAHTEARIAHRDLKPAIS